MRGGHKHNRAYETIIPLDNKSRPHAEISGPVSGAPLRNRRLGGFKFVRQEAIGEYFADLACRELRLIVEVDGATHATFEESSRDERRDAYLARRGYRVMRVSNEDVRANLSGVLDTIMLELRSRVMSTTIQRAAPHPRPRPPGGERE